MDANLHIVNGLPAPTFVLQENMDRLKGLELFPDDVWIASYPKTGTTWTQHIVRLIRNNGEEESVKISNAVPWLEATAGVRKNIESIDVDAFCGEVGPEDMPRPRAFMTHFPYDLLPCGPPHMTPCKYIYTSRNPKDVVVSMYCMLKTGYFHDLDWDTYCGRFCSGQVYFGSYFDHLLSWWVHRDDKNVLFLKYEDMKKDLRKTVNQIASFMGAEISSEVLSQIADLASFKRMKENDKVNYSWDKAYVNENGDHTFLRKGVVGDWKNFFSAQQSAKIDEICAEKFKDTGLEFDYD